MAFTDELAQTHTRTKRELTIYTLEQFPLGMGNTCKTEPLDAQWAEVGDVVRFYAPCSARQRTCEYVVRAKRTETETVYVANCR